MSRVRSIAVAAVAAFVAIAPASPVPAHEGEARCRQFGMPAPACTAVARTERGIARTGVSAADFTDDPQQVVDIADFYFAPRVIQVYDETRIVFVNDNPEGGNRHSLSSSDWGTGARVLPVPGLEFGGGKGFRSTTTLLPGDVFVLDVDIASMNPAAYLPTGMGDYWIGYHCYVHGAAQMSGMIRVLPRA